MRKKLGVSRTHFDRMVAYGSFGKPIRYGGERGQRYFDVAAVNRFFINREYSPALAIACAVMRD